MKKGLWAAVIAALLLCLLCGAAVADSFTDSTGITWYYNISDNTAEVTGITLPDGVTEVDIPATLGGCSVTGIGNYAFENCIYLTSVTIPDSVTSIGYRAFRGCSSLESVTIPDSVTSIGDAAFSYCSGLGSVTITSGVTSIGSSAFEGCSNLWSVTIPSSVTSIGNYAFSRCSGLTSVTIPNSVTSIGSNAFQGCSSLTSVTIPSGVTSIGYHAFSGCSSLERVTIPDSVTSIGDYAFNSCSNLTSVTIPAGVTDIGSFAFQGCSSLTSVTIPAGATSIGESAFKGRSKLESVTIPDSVTSIGDSAFSGCSSLESVTIPDSVTSIGGNAFMDCISLESVTIPDSVTSIGNAAFYGCSSLKSVTIPITVTNINKYAFYNCTSLNSVTIPSSVTSISDNAFYGCHSLASVSIPDSVTSIGGSAFQGCSSLTSVTIPDSVTSIGSSAFKDCSNLESVTIPADVTSIGGAAFQGCSGLTSVTIPDGVTSIGSYAFYDCTSLMSVTIPGSVTSIGDHAFDGCSSLTDLYYEGSISRWDSITKGKNAIPGGCSVHCNTAAYFLQVTESRPDDVSGAWSVTSGGLSYGNGSVLYEAVYGDIGGDPGVFTLTLTPGGCGCTGGLYRAGVLLAPITDTVTTYTFTPEADIRVDLTWYDKANQYTVTYDGNGSNGVMAAQLVKKNGSVYAAKNGFDGYVTEPDQSYWGFFTGWNTMANGAGLEYQPNAVIENITADITLYAQWVSAYRLKFYNNGGKGNMDEMRVPKDGNNAERTVTLPECGFTKSGKALQEWNTVANPTALDPGYQPGEQLTLTADTKLYAIWGDGWTVTFDANDGTGSTFKKNVLQGQAMTLPDCPFSRVNSVFAGWNTLADGTGTMYQPGNAFTPTGNATLYAQWEAVTFGNADFKLPTGTRTIGESAFENDKNITAVDAHTCTAIGANAFNGCTGLTKIRLPKDCTIASSAFDDTALQTIFAPAGGTTEEWADEKGIEFVAE